MGPWKAPGEDLLPAGFLKICGRPLYEALVTLAIVSFALGYFPLRLRSVTVVVLQKPGKPEAIRKTPDG